jgi:thioredoxin 1
MRMIVDVTDATFTETVLREGESRTVAVDFWAEWCPGCRKIAGPLGELADELDGTVLVTKINADENPETARRYGVMSLPSLLLFRDGDLVAELVGARPKSQLRDYLTKR